MGVVFGAANFSVNLIGGGLVVLGVALLVATLAFWQSAVEDPEVLAPLEVMADRRFARAGHDRRIEILDSVRPSTPEPPARRARKAAIPKRPVVDESSFDDALEPEPERDEVVVPEVIDPLLHFQNKRPRK